MLRSPNSPLRGASGGLQAPTFATATDGNHGISVAAGAWITGCAAVCFLPRHVERAYEDAMRLLGAQVIRVDGTYDVAVAQAASAARENGWTVVSDITEEVFDAVTRDVLAGYGVMVNECAAQLAKIGHLYGRESLTHVFVQAALVGWLLLSPAACGNCWTTCGRRSWSSSRAARIVCSRPLGTARCATLPEISKRAWACCRVVGHHEWHGPS